MAWCGDDVVVLSCGGGGVVVVTVGNTEYRGPNDGYTVIWVPSIAYIRKPKNNCDKY